ncbi:membrane fusion protein (multidrug efflux system) [Flavobacterium nitrogenifigens]|uniref:Membrane fusion protein (Multidrug efflux system) n=2 Tax=Flavobacterium TaxID=237 RepID=A0A7W7IXC2_9FLAO|nr:MULTISPECIES: efflux RND transporter periplasmic adaptor subunit [Flavobacterium]MBB4802344.1 membrane fusion protein (multidrug efflux system) [Flavobacterium nitrogenifigens]MBB6387302.1 membrane fusion protein (multidrug efflux system) [Flavobacterium notoginsengisoli]
MTKQFFKNNQAVGKIAVLLIILSFTSCGKSGEAQMAPPKPEVDFLLASSASGDVEKKYPGTVEGTVNVDIKAQVSGYLEAIYVKEGDYVNKGQSLFKIKGDVYAEQVNNSRAAYKSALANQANAKLEVEKIKPLVEGKVFSDMQLKTAQANYEAATAQVAQAKAALGSSQLNADFSLIKAPVSGYISRIPNRIGNLVTPNDAVPLTTLSEINNVFVYFSLTEADYLAFSKDSKSDKSVSLIMADDSEYDQKGKLEVASGNIDRSTGTIALKAIFPNPKKELRSGGSARIVLNKSLSSVITIPMASVKDIQDKFFVFVLKEGNKVVMVPIEIAGNSGTNYYVKSGLNSGDKVALNSIDVLYDSMEVVPKTAAKNLSSK